MEASPAIAAAGSEEPVDVWLSINSVAKRGGITTKTVANYVNTPELGFPQPKIIRHRRFFRLSELKRWERRFPDLQKRA